MRLRHRLLLLFATFAVLPLLAMGAFDYASSLRHLEAVLTVQTEGIVTRAAQELKDRLDLQASDISLLSTNLETQQLLAAAQGGDPVAMRTAHAAAGAYWQELWRTLRFGYWRVALYDAAGRSQLALATEGDSVVGRGMAMVSEIRSIQNPETGATIGRLEFTPRVADLFRSPIFRSAFGAGGRTLLIDRRTQRVVLEPTGTVPALDAPPFGPDRLREPHGTFGYRIGAERRVASFVSFEEPAWTLVVTASVDEFAAPFIRLRLLDLGLLLGVVLAVSAGFFLLLRRATASLDRITIAADLVGRGDFSPALPATGTDEVGRLAAAFRLMTDRIREMIAQVEAGRQMGVLGRFAAELSHEIRNPLTAIKLNLQGLERDAREGRIPEQSRRAVELALREIRRLDQAVKAALRTGRPPAEPRPFRLDVLLHDAVELMRPQAAAQQVTIHCETGAIHDQASGDEEAVRGALLNLLLNAIEAMPSGGTLRLTTANLVEEDSAMFELRIQDEGPGIPAELRDRIFRPFFTTKAQGTGLGLSMALQTMLAHRGGLTLADPGGRGTEVILTIPVQLTRVSR